MSTQPDVHHVAATILGQLEAAWNAGDGTAFTEPFARDADFVTVRGELIAGPDIGPGHDRLFTTVYAGSTIGYRLVRARRIGPDVVLAHFRGSLRVPAGPVAGAQEALGSLLITADPQGWRVAAFHNTHVA